MLKKSIYLFFLPPLLYCSAVFASQNISQKESWWLHDKYNQFSPKVIAVLPMENYSLEPDVDKHLFNEVYNRLRAKGYMVISKEKVMRVMGHFGIQTPGQLAGISPRRLGEKLNCNAVLRGKIDQSGAIHKGTYDAVVVSCSLRLMDCETRQVLWRTEQWRTAHRQWAIDPVNMLINFAGHENASREKRVAWLVQEMLKTLPAGHVKIETGNLLEQAVQIPPSQD